MLIYGRFPINALPVNLIWGVILGTVALVTTAVFLIVAIIMSNRQKLRDQQEKLNAVEASEKKYRNLVESMKECVMIVDPQLNIRFMNNQCREFLSTALEDVLGKPVGEIFRGVDDDGFESHIQRVVSSGKPNEFENQFQIGDRVIWLDTMFVPQVDLEGNLTSVMTLSRDTTIRRTMEDQLRERNKILRAQRETLRVLSSEVIKAQEMERKRISQELHDEVGQSLTAVRLNLELVRKPGQDEEELERRLRDCKLLVDKTLEDVHRFAYELRPKMLDELGLLPSLRSHARSYTERTGIKVTLRGDEQVENLTTDLKTIIYRICQESLNNVLKHAMAKKVEVDLVVEKEMVQVTIRDDGRGFDPAQLPAKKSSQSGLGLKGIQERVEIIGGKFRVLSQPGKGTVLEAAVPFHGL